MTWRFARSSFLLLVKFYLTCISLCRDAACLLDGNPDAFTSVASRFHGVDESMQPEARVYHHALELVLPNEDTALRVVRIIACMDADALEIRHAQQQWQPTFESWRIR